MPNSDHTTCTIIHVLIIVNEDLSVLRYAAVRIGGQNKILRMRTCEVTQNL
jgi:hypothetical protein